MVDWLNDKYTAEDLHAAGQHFDKNGYVQLLQFLSKKGLDSFKLSFKKVYEPLKFSYSVAKPPKFALSKEFCAVLSTLVGKDVHPEKLTVYKFEPGDYTVLYDDLAPGKGTALLLDVSDLDESWGGYTSFMEDEELLRIVPRKNALSLVNHEGVLSFTKYVNHNDKQPRIFLYCVLQ